MRHGNRYLKSGDPEAIRADRPHRGPSQRTMRLYFAAMGLMPVLRGNSGQSPAEGQADLQDAAPTPDYDGDAEFIERELLIPEDRGAK